MLFIITTTDQTWVVNGLEMTQKLQAAMLFAASSRRLLGDDSCAACKKTAPCYSLARVNGKMSTEGPFADCAKARGGCDACFPGSASGSLPPVATRVLMTAPAPSKGQPPVPPWGELKRFALTPPCS